MTKFRLHIISQREQFAAIRDSLPSFSSSQVTAHPPSQLMEILENGVNSRAIILWADSNFIRTLQHLSSLHDIESASHQIIAVGADLSASDAMTLGRIGISRYFDLPTDEEAFASEVIGRYESWRQSTQTAMAEAGIEDVVIGSSPPIRRLQTMIRKVAPRDRLMVLIRGETGTGKGLIAKMLHQFSTRKDKAFVEINCTAIPEGLVEAELFGHEKGAFTDAHRSRKGIFELAHGGTLFLDEIGYLKPDIQVKLLKVLEDRRFRRVGGEKDIQVDCRIIAGTSVNLEEKIAAGAFRQDLYYRLNVFPITVPPLRDRGRDIITLAEHFLKHFSREHGVDTNGFDDSAVEYLLSESWRGNVRELKHTVERAVILGEDGAVTAGILSGNMELPDPDAGEVPQNRQSSATLDAPGSPILRIPWPASGLSMDEIQGEVIRQVLELTGGNRSEAARLLNISRSRLLRRINTGDGE